MNTEAIMTVNHLCAPTGLRLARVESDQETCIGDEPGLGMTSEDRRS